MVVFHAPKVKPNVLQHSERSLHELCFCWSSSFGAILPFPLLPLNHQGVIVQYWKDPLFLLLLFLVWYVFSMCEYVVYVVCCMHVNVQCMRLWFSKQRSEKVAWCLPLSLSLLYFLRQSLSWNYKLVRLTRVAAYPFPRSGVFTSMYTTMTSFSEAWKGLQR